MTIAADASLDDLRLRLAPLVADAAVFDGWSAQAVQAAAAQAEVDGDVAAYAFRGGAMDMVAAWVASVDVAMTQALPAAQLAAMPIRERIRSLVQARLDAIAGQEEALSRALAIMAMPQNVASAVRLGWHSADAMWRLAGDTATDYNHYTKRAILAGIYAATLAGFADDDSAGKAETRASSIGGSTGSSASRRPRRSCCVRPTIASAWRGCWAACGTRRSSIKLSQAIANKLQYSRRSGSAPA